MMMAVAGGGRADVGVVAGDREPVSVPGGDALESAGACHIWWLPVTPAWELVGVMDDAERARWSAFVRTADRVRYGTAHVGARLVLGRYLGVAPEALEFDRTCGRCGADHGKPEVRVPGTPLRFSISHSGDRVALAMATEPVGVDVERVEERTDVTALVGHVFSTAEQQWFDRVAPGRRRGTFFGCWSRKEAVLKATGHGLSVAMTDLTLTPPGELTQLLHWRGQPCSVGRVQLADMAAGAGYAAAVALISVHPIRVDRFHLLPP